jgi:hypothetical protein
MTWKQILATAIAASALVLSASLQAKEPQAPAGVQVRAVRQAPSWGWTPPVTSVEPMHSESRKHADE